jgi:hypothetical protein
MTLGCKLIHELVLEPNSFFYEITFSDQIGLNIAQTFLEGTLIINQQFVECDCHEVAVLLSLKNWGVVVLLNRTHSIRVFLVRSLAFLYF